VRDEVTSGAGRPRHVLVIGGGITGLAAAHTLATAEDAPRVTVLEADDRLGGKILTSPFAGLPAVDEGPDSLLARVPEALELCRQVGLGGELVHPTGAPAYVWWGGQMHPLPEGLVLGVPAGVVGLIRSRLLSWRGTARAGLEPVLPGSWARERIEADDLGGIVRRRFGAEVLDRLVGPLVGGINAGDPACMSAAAVAPQLADAAARHRSLLLGLRADARSRAASNGGPPGPVFAAPRAGVGALVERTAAAARALGVEIRTGCAATPLERHGSGWRCGDLEPDAVIVAVPARTASDLLRDVAPEAAGRLAGFDAVSVAMVTLAVPESGFTRALDGSGYLVPRAAQRAVTACSWASTKWAHQRVPGQAVLRVSVGRAGDESAAGLDDDSLLAAVLTDLRHQMGLRTDPTEVRISRWPRGLPQYRPGHLDRVGELERRLAEEAPGVVLAGASYRGVGVPSCIRSARVAARAMLGPA
jgi:oxygen-dependent protoporphyrinogen oxidase